MSVEFVQIDDLDAVMVRHHLWAKAYWHDWEHLEHQWEMETRHELVFMDRQIGQTA